jgi:hypothetical protein
MKTKNLFFAVIFLLINSVTMSQNDLFLGFNSTTAGRNISFGYSKSVNTYHTFGIGLRINISKINHPDDQAKIFFKRLYATELYQNFGLQTYYHRAVFSNLQCLKPYLFYDLQLTRSTTWNRWYFPYSYDTNGDLLYKEYRYYFGPFWWIEQNIGIGFRVKVIDSFYLFQNIGGGITFILGEDERLPTTYDKFSWEFGYLLSVGVSYRLKE